MLRPRALLVLLVVAVAGCRGDLPEDDLPVRARVAIAPTPPILGPNRIVVTLTDLEGDPLEGAALRVEGTMDHAGMTPVHREADSAGEGRHVVPDFDFTMGGDWVLLLRITLPDGQEIVRRHRVHVYSGGPGSGRGGGTGGGGGTDGGGG